MERSAFSRILVAVDFSPASDAAAAFALRLAAPGLRRLLLGSSAEGVLRRASIPVIVLRAEAARTAIALAARDGANVVFAHVVHAPKYEAAETALERATRDAAAAGVPCDTAIVHGTDVAETLRVSAEACRADLIVTGTHGRRGVDRWMLGSVAESIVRESTVPVVVIPAAPLHADDPLAAGTSDRIPYQIAPGIF